MKNKPFVWQMVKEAAEQSENEIITYEEIREYITARYEIGRASCRERV